VTVYSPPVNSQTTNIVQCEASYLELELNISAIPAPGYQWYHNGSPLAGETNYNIIIDSLRYWDAGYYYCEISHYCGNLTSDSIEVEVNFAPYFKILPPQHTSLCEGESVTFSALALGTAPITYQWYKDGIVLPGETNTTLTIDPLTVADDGKGIPLSQTETTAISNPTKPGFAV